MGIKLIFRNLEKSNNFGEVFKLKRKKKMKLISVLAATTQAFGLFGQSITIWGEWGSWSCQGGVRQRQAPCLGGLFYCWGPLIERDPTNPSCEPKTIWGRWAPWGTCDTTGVRTREAPCLAGAPTCYGPLKEDMACQPTTSIWGSWSNGGAFGPCNPATGKRTRTKPCLAGPPTCFGDLVEEEMCSARPGVIYN